MLNHTSLPDSPIQQKLLSSLIPDRYFRLWFRHLSRRQRLVWRQRLAGGFLLMVSVFIVAGGVWRVDKQKQVAINVLISPLGEETGKNELTLFQNPPNLPLPDEKPGEEGETKTSAADPIASVSIPTPFPQTTTVEEMLKRSGIGSVAETTPALSGFQIPEHLLSFLAAGEISPKKGKMIARITADWIDTDTPVIWANFSGSSRADLFEIAGNGRMLAFNNYATDGEVADSLLIELVDYYKGKEFTFEAKWDFDQNPGIKEILVDGAVAGYAETDFKPPAGKEAQVYTWQVGELAFSDTW